MKQRYVVRWIFIVTEHGSKRGAPWFRRSSVHCKVSRKAGQKRSKRNILFAHAWALCACSAAGGDRRLHALPARREEADVLGRHL
jgi:hypothetical protein